MTRLDTPDRTQAIDPRHIARDEAAQPGRRLLPWAVSLLVHLAVVVLAIFLIWSAEVREEDERTVATWAPQPPITPIQLVAPPAPTSKAAIDLPVTAPRPASPDQPVVLEVMQPGRDLPPAQPAATQPPSGTDRVTRPSLFDTIDPPEGDKGVGSVVFLIDASGSMVEQFTLVQRELSRAVRHLAPDQRFTVIYFQKGGAVEAAPRGLTPATERNIQRFFAWTGADGRRVRPHGPTDPLPALALALAYRPDEVRLLSDNITGSGAYSLSADRLLSEVERIKRQRRAERTRISTIQFLRPDPTRALWRLADAHGGRCRFVASIAGR